MYLRRCRVLGAFAKTVDCLQALFALFFAPCVLIRPDMSYLVSSACGTRGRPPLAGRVLQCHLASMLVPNMRPLHRLDRAVHVIALLALDFYLHCRVIDLEPVIQLVAYCKFIIYKDLQHNKARAIGTRFCALPY
jgi:hypothetical protein